MTRASRSHQYLDSVLEASLPEGAVTLEVTSELPWKGGVSAHVTRDSAGGMGSLCASRLG